MSVESETIYKVIDLFGGGDRWCQHHDALNDNGDPVPAVSINAQKFCLRGALMRVVTEQSRDVASYAKVMNQIEFYTQTRYATDPVKFNDRHSYEDVVLMLKEVATAIE